MSRSYLTDIEHEGEMHSAWVSLNCKYCQGRGSEYTCIKDPKTKKWAAAGAVPCRCIKLVKNATNANTQTEPVQIPI
jgi:hypothetical protein